MVETTYRGKLPGMKMVVVLFSVSTYICTNVAQKRNEVISGTWVVVRTSQPMDFMHGPYYAVPNPQAEEKETFAQYFCFLTIVLFRKNQKKGNQILCSALCFYQLFPLSSLLIVNFFFFPFPLLLQQNFGLKIRCTY